MRQPDHVETREVNGLSIEVKEWVDWADIPWNGDEQGSEVYDISSRATYRLDDNAWTGRGSLCSVWVTASNSDSQYLRDERENVTQEAIADLFASISRDANGETVKRAYARQSAALKALAMVQPSPVQVGVR